MHLKSSGEQFSLKSYELTTLILRHFLSVSFPIPMNSTKRKELSVEHLTIHVSEIQSSTKDYALLSHKKVLSGLALF